jgi:arginyl-tRNA synthetase
MFEEEKAIIAAKIKTYLQQEGIEDAVLEYRQIPFSGEWGLAIPLFPVAAGEARSGKKVNVPQRAQALAEGIKVSLGESLADFSHVLKR